MDKLIKVKAMKRLYYEPEGRPDKGKLYLEGQEFMCEESRFSDFDKETKTLKGGVIRGCMRRLDKPQVEAGKKG
jgi:hypothetical protein